MKIVLSIIALSIAFFSQAFAATNYPTKGVTIIVPFPPAAPPDILTRVLSSGLSEKWKQPVNVENRPGAGGLVGTAAVARANPDGHTILLNVASVLTYKLFVKDLNFDPLRDLRPVAKIASYSLVAAIPPQLGPKTLKEFIAYAKARPKALNYAVIPYATMDLDLAIFLEKAGLDMVRVPTPGGAQFMTTMVRNDAQITLSSVSQLRPYLANGRLLAVATTGRQRMTQLPDVPTFLESNIDFVTESSNGLYVPRKTPSDVAAKIAADAISVAHSPSIASKLENLGYDLSDLVLDEYEKEVRVSAEIYAQTARKLGLEAQ